MPTTTLPLLVTQFQAITGHALDLPAEYVEALEGLCRHLDKNQLRPAADRKRWLLARINAKFRFNRDPVAEVYAIAAGSGVTFNYHEKCAIQLAFDLGDRAGFGRALDEAQVPRELRRSLMEQFKPVSEEDTLRQFRTEIEDPSKLRKEKGDRPVDREILLAAFSAFVFSAAEERVLHAYFDKGYDPATYEESFWLQLRRMYPQLYTRNRALDIVAITPEIAASFGSYTDLHDRVLDAIAESYRGLNNHGHLAMWLPPIRVSGRLVTWELACDAMLFAEKHDEVALKKTYFRHRDVASATTAYIPSVNAKAAAFEIANEGFTYRDTFVCPPHVEAACGTESLLLLFQKNRRDETLIPCPACRSHDVQGNSYPSLGVRSWECRNLLCPDRSKYNRGKRYSFKALLMQEAIDDPTNEIPVESVRSWVRDVQPGRTLPEATEMLIRHYSLRGDTVRIVGAELPSETHGRIAVRGVLDGDSSRHAVDFFKSAWFSRYVTPSTTERSDAAVAVRKRGALRLLEGDARYALATLPADYFDAAVTSPPYYNARDYAQWDNIYCYLHDMLTVARHTFRVLKPGAPYLYNIFDYFDNEKNIVFSAMGDKRLILSAYTVDLFRRAGFCFAGNVTWDKGDIEGKRGFNAGNFSPYYQAPFNCWEHVLVFYKPPAPLTREFGQLPAVLRAQPVLKMVHGENVHGHTAPFPFEIPALLDALIAPGSRVLDPFGGSCTTARALASRHREIVCVERSAEYCDLAMRLFDEECSGGEPPPVADPGGIQREDASAPGQLAMFSK